MAMSRTANNQDVKPPQVRWQFIDSSNDNAQNLTQVKRHVMQEYMRQKRLENQHQNGSDDGVDEDQTTSAKDKKNNKKKKATTDISNNKPKRAQKKQSVRMSNIEKKSNSKLIETPGPAKRAGEQRVGYYMTLHPHNASVARPTSSPWDFSSPSNSSDQFTDAVAGYNSPALSAWSRTELSPPPQTLLSAARTDPFDTLPLQLTAQDQRLFDFYVNEMPACSYGDHFRTRNAHNWYIEVFVPEAMKGPVTFVNTILVHAANTWAWLHNQIETQETLSYRQRALQMLIDHTQRYPNDRSDNVITACMSAAAVEDFDPRPERKQISWIHMRQARRMIKQRGGPAAFENTKLAMLINWQDYILAGYESEEGCFHFEDERSSPSTATLIPTLPSPPCSVSSVPIDCTSSLDSARFANTLESEVRIQCEDFLNFLSRCEHLAISQHATLPQTTAPNRHAAFQPGSILGRILASPNGKRFTASGNRKQFISRLAAVMMLNAALWDYRSSVHRAESFLDNIVCRILDSEVNMSSSVEALLQILLACQDFPADTSNIFAINPLGLLHDDLDVPDYTQYSPTATSPSARPWFVGRMLKIAKRLSFASWIRVNDFLFSCLTLQIREPSMLNWENDLRQEILQAPLTSYIMPALQ